MLCQFGMGQHVRVGVFVVLSIFFGHGRASSGSWPDGTYGLPMTDLGCPLADGFNWVVGSRTQQTEDGSHASENNHLAVEATKYATTNKIVQNFCMKTAHLSDSKYEWERGKYCIYKKSDCPSGFKEGWIYWDDAAPLLWGEYLQNHSGTLPDGEYDRNTKIFYCCRDDGPTEQPIKLPSYSPFFLFKQGKYCQEVQDMEVTEEWVYWSDEDTLNLSHHDGLHPKVYRSKYPSKYLKLHYCYYTPKGPNQSVRTVRIVLFTILGIAVCAIFVFAVVCLIQKLCSKKMAEDPALQIDAGATEIMLTNLGGANCNPSGGASAGPTSSNGPSVRFANEKTRQKGAFSCPVVSLPPMGDNGGDHRPVGRAEEPPPDIIRHSGGLSSDIRPDSKPPSYDEVMRQDSIQGSPPQQ